MIKTIFFTSIIFYTNGVFCQTTPQAKVTVPVVNRHVENYSPDITMVDPVTGKAFKNNSDVNYPYFLEDWLYSLIKLNDGRVFDMVRARLNITNSLLYFKSVDNVEMFFSGAQVKELNFYATPETKKIIYKFKTGFPKIENNDQNTFYQVLSEGTITLLKCIRKNIVENKNDLSGEIEKQFNIYENYYLFTNNQIKKLKKDRDFILKALNDKKEKIEGFVQQSSTNFKNVNDIILLFNFYNSLFLP